MCFFESEGAVADCQFRANFTSGAGGHGGAIACAFGADVTIDNCTIAECTIAEDYGGGLPSGGAVYGLESAIHLSRCTIYGNSAGQEGYGGAVSAADCGLSLVNCRLNGNQAQRGGAISSAMPGGALKMINCTLHGNRAETSTAVYWNGWSRYIDNSIVWNGADWTSLPTFFIKYSDIEGGWSGEGNINADPLFVDPGYWDDNGTPGDPDDDFWVDGNYHVQPGSPCIDAANNDKVPPDVTTDLDARPRFIDDPHTVDTGLGDPPIVDMGAYEFLILGDLNCDQVVDFWDINPFVLALSNPDAYAEAYPDCPFEYRDINNDGEFDFEDINPFVTLLSGGG